MRTTAILQRRLSLALPEKSLRMRFAAGAFWSLVGVAIAQGSSLAALLVTARILGKAGFGELGMIQSTTGMFGVFAGFGLGITVTKHVAEFRRSDPLRAGRVVGLSIVVALISASIVIVFLAVFSPYLAAKIIDAPYLAAELRLACGLLFFNTLIGVQNGALAGLEAFKTIAKVNICRGIVVFPLVIIGASLLGLSGALIGLVAAAGIGWFINYSALFRVARKVGIHRFFRNIRLELPILWAFSAPAFFSGAMVTPIMWFARVLFVNQPDGYAQMGVFTAATCFQSAMNLVGGTIGTVLLPLLASKDAGASMRFERGNILISWAIGVLPTLPLICFPEVIGKLLGPQYSGPSFNHTFVITMCYTCIMLYKQGLARILVTNNLMWWTVLSNFVWGGLLILAAWKLRGLGSTGLAAAFLLAYSINTGMFIPLYTRRRLVPLGTIVSVEAFLIWVLLAVLATLSLLDVRFEVRIGVLLLALPVMFSMFHRLFKGNR